MFSFFLNIDCVTAYFKGIGQGMVIVQYTNMVFVKSFNKDVLCQMRGIVNMFLEKIFVRKLRRTMKKELLHQYKEAALKYQENMTEAFRSKLKKYYASN